MGWEGRSGPEALRKATSSSLCPCPLSLSLWVSPGLCRLSVFVSVFLSVSIHPSSSCLLLSSPTCLCLIASVSYRLRTFSISLSTDSSTFSHSHGLSSGWACLRGTWLPVGPMSRAAPSWPTCQTRRSSGKLASAIPCTGSSCALPFRRWCHSHHPQRLPPPAL